MATAVATQRSTKKQIEDFLAVRRFAAVGVSRNEKHDSRMLMREFIKREYDVLPVNPSANEIEGRQCYGSVREIQPAVEAVLLLTPAAQTMSIVRECADIGVKRIWMYRATGAGAVDAEAVQFCHDHGIDVIPGECPFMFLPHTGIPHRIHGFVRLILGSYPK